MDNPYIACEWCREPLKPDDPNVLRAFEQIDVTAMGTGKQPQDGLAVLFHRVCFPGGTRYRLAD
jgi:hypothetical protein